MNENGSQRDVERALEVRAWFKKHQKALRRTDLGDLVLAEYRAMRRLRTGGQR